MSLQLTAISNNSLTSSCFSLITTIHIYFTAFHITEFNIEICRDLPQIGNQSQGAFAVLSFNFDSVIDLLTRTKVKWGCSEKTFGGFEIF